MHIFPFTSTGRATMNVDEVLAKVDASVKHDTLLRVASTTLASVTLHGPGEYETLERDATKLFGNKALVPALISLAEVMAYYAEEFSNIGVVTLWGQYDILESAILLAIEGITHSLPHTTVMKAQRNYEVDGFKAMVAEIGTVLTPIVNEIDNSNRKSREQLYADRRVSSALETGDNKKIAGAISEMLDRVFGPLDAKNN